MAPTDSQWDSASENIDRLAINDAAFAPLPVEATPTSTMCHAQTLAVGVLRIEAVDSGSKDELRELSGKVNTRL